jgi:hypothetical protein
MAGSVDLLIGDQLRDFSRSAFSGHEDALPVYLHLWESAEQVYGGFSEPQMIQTLAFSPELLQWTLQSLRQLDEIIALDFYFQDNNNGTLIDLYLDTEIKLDGGSNVLGLAAPNGVISGDAGDDQHQGWWEIFLNAPSLQLDSDQLRYALIHELGHALGLEHPFDRYDGDGWGEAGGDPDADQTVMSYTQPDDGHWPDFYSPLDRAALATIWGLEPGHSTWRFWDAEADAELVVSAVAAEQRLAEGRVGEQLLGPVLNQQLPDLAQSIEPFQLISSSYLVPQAQSPQGTVFYAFTDEALLDESLVQAYSYALQLLDAELELDFQLHPDPSSPLVRLLLDRQSLSPDQLLLDWIDLGTIDSVVQEVVIDDVSQLLALQHTITVDPINPYYQDIDAFVSHSSYLEYAALHQLSLALGLQHPWSEDPAQWSSFDYSQTSLARRIDEPILSGDLQPVDLAALVSLHGVESHANSQPVDFSLPSIGLGASHATPQYWLRQTQLTVPVLRTGNPELDLSVVLELVAQPVDPDQDSTAFNYIELITIPAGVNALDVQIDLPTGMVDVAELRLSHPVNASADSEALALDVHALEVALTANHLVDARVVSGASQAQLLDQGGDHLFYGFESGVDPAWIASIESFIDHLDASMLIDFHPVDATDSLAQLVFRQPSGTTELSVTNQLPTLELAGELYGKQSVLQFDLPEPLVGDDDFIRQLSAVDQEILLAFGFELPVDAADGDRYTYTDVLPRDSALFTTFGALPATDVRLTELDQAALAILGLAADGVDPMASPFYPSSTFEILPRPGHSGVVGSDTHLGLSIQRHGDLELESRLVLLATPSADDPEDAWSQELSFAAGQDQVDLDLQWPQHHVSSLELSLHTLSGVGADHAELQFDVDALDQFNSRSLRADDSLPVIDFAFNAESIPEYSSPGVVVGHLLALPGQTHSSLDFELVDGPGADHHDILRLEHGTLFLDAMPVYQQQDSYSFRVRATDDSSAFFERRFAFDVLDVPERDLPLDVGVSKFAATPAHIAQLVVSIPFAPELQGYSDVTLEVSFPAHAVSAVQLLSSDATDVRDQVVSPDLVSPSLSSLTGRMTLVVHDPAAGALNPVFGLSFEPEFERFDPLTGQPLVVEFVYQGFDAFSSSSLFHGQIQATAFNLDVDGDGSVNAFSDGLMVIRKLLGAGFAGEALTSKALPLGATRDSEQIHQFIEMGVASGDLDLDGDGTVSAFSDGLILIRHMLGFNRDDLLDKALSPDSPLMAHADPVAEVVDVIQGLIAPAHATSF